MEDKDKKWVRKIHDVKKAEWIGVLLAAIFLCGLSAMAAENDEQENTFNEAVSEETQQDIADAGGEDILPPATGDLDGDDSQAGPDAGGTEAGSTQVPETGTGNQGTEQPETEEQGTEQPGTENQSTEQPETEEQGTEKPGTEQPETGEQGTEESGTEQPETGEQSTEKPGMEQPETGEQGTEKPEIEPGKEMETESETETEEGTEEDIMLLDDVGPDAVVNTPDELYKWGIDCTDGKITGVSDPLLMPDRLVLPEGVVGIDNWSFSNGTFSNLILPDSLVSIATWAFADCQNLTGIVFGSGLTQMAMGAFYNCSALKYVDMSRVDKLGLVGNGIFVYAGDSNTPTLESFVFNDKALESLGGYTPHFFSHVNVKNIWIVHSSSYTGSDSKLKAADDIWVNLRDIVGGMGMDRSQIQSATIMFGYNGTTEAVNVTECEQRKIMAEAYFTYDSYDTRTPDELWDICFNEHSAKKAGLYVLTDVDGQGVLNCYSFIDFYTGTNAAGEELRETIPEIDKLDAVYESLLQYLVSQSQTLQENMDTGILYVEVAQEAENSSGEPEQINARSEEVRRELMKSQVMRDRQLQKEGEEHGSYILRNARFYSRQR